MKQLSLVGRLLLGVCRSCRHGLMSCRSGSTAERVDVITMSV